MTHDAPYSGPGRLNVGGAAALILILGLWRVGPGAQELFFGSGPIRAVQQFFGLGHPLPFHVFSLLGDTWGMILVLGVAFWIFGRGPAYALVALVAVGAGLWMLVVGLFDVERPSGPGIVVYEHLEIGAFPSGHTFQAVSAWGLLYVIGRVPLLVPVLAAVLVTVGRLYLGAHFVGDVLAGIVMGVLWAWAFARLWPPMRDFLARHTAVLYALAGIALLAVGYLWYTELGTGHLRRWEVAGLALGAAVAIPLERRLVGYVPRRDDALRQALKPAVGIAGLVALYLAEQRFAQATPAAGAAAAALGVVWALVAVPRLLRGSGLSGGGAA